MKIIRERSEKEVIEYFRDYRWTSDTGAGFSFPCDKGGVQLPMAPEALENFINCCTGEFSVVYRGVQEYRRVIREPAVGLCCCGEEVDLDGFTNTCACGRDYNSSGQLLAPRECWGEETGESLGDILGVG